MSLRNKLVALVILVGALGFTSLAHANLINPVQQCLQNCVIQENSCMNNVRPTCNARCGTDASCVSQCVAQQIQACENANSSCQAACGY